jgi:hypothetical protein
VNDIAITLSIIGLALVLFAWNAVPAVVVAIGPPWRSTSPVSSPCRRL